MRALRHHLFRCCLLTINAQHLASCIFGNEYGMGFMGFLCCVFLQSLSVLLTLMHFGQGCARVLSQSLLTYSVSVYHFPHYFPSLPLSVLDARKLILQKGQSWSLQNTIMSRASSSHLDPSDLQKSQHYI